MKTDILIVGGGPGGACAALKLSHLGIPCTLVEKDSFPRDKICGDALSPMVTTLLGRIDPALLESLEQVAWSMDCWGIKFVMPNDAHLNLSIYKDYDKEKDEPAGYVAARMDFDNMLVEAVRKRDNINYIENCTIRKYEPMEGGGYIAEDSTGAYRFEAKIVMAADGANSYFARHIGGLEKDIEHHAGAVRAYYENVSELDEDNFIELHYIKDLVPGYFWIFPMSNNRVNVGLGMLSKEIGKNKVNLTRKMHQIIREHPIISKRFKHAVPLGKTLGFGLPMGSRRREISGDHFMLLGDAGHLIDPLTGEGIGNAIYSGIIAAELAEKCLAQNNFSAEFMKAYDTRVWRVMGPELALSYRIQRLMRMPFLLDIFAWVAKRNKKVENILIEMFHDLELREKIFNPFYLLKRLI